MTEGELVVISASVLMVAEFAQRGGFGIVDEVMHRLQSTQVREYSLSGPSSVMLRKAHHGMIQLSFRART